MKGRDSLNEVTVKTSFGTLVAQIGSDTEFPEVLVFLRKESGPELMLAAITDQSISGVEDVLRIAVYGNVAAEDYTNRFVLTKEDINSPTAMWQ